MDSYEIVKRAIRFEGPERIPFNFGGIGYSDFAGVDYNSSMTKVSEIEEIDEWGCTWEKILEDKTMGQCVGHPLEDWDNLKEYKWPDPDAPERFKDKDLKGQLSHADEKFVLAHIDGILRRARFLRGFSNIMMDFHLHPKKVHELLEKLLDFFLRILANYAKFKGIHGISMPEDWGTQYSSFISIPLFREFFKPIYKRLFEAVHSYGWVFRMHSDGKINDIIEEWIDCGLDVLELEQPRALGIEEIGRRFRGRICFEGSIDIQATVPALVYRPLEFKGKIPGILLIGGWIQSKWDFQHFKVQLANEGYVVVIPDCGFVGERKTYSSESEQFNLVPIAQLLGKTFMGMNTYDNIRAIDYLQSRDDVDKERIGVIGLCWGGMQTWTLAAVEERVKVAVPVCGTSTYEALLEEHINFEYHGCLGTYIPNLVKYGDIQDILALIAPRPLLIMNNSNDQWFPVSGYLKVCGELEKVYQIYGASERFRHLLHSTIHDITPDFAKEAISWFKKYL